MQGGGRPDKLFDELVGRALSAATITNRKPVVALSLAPIAEAGGMVRKFASWLGSAAFRGAEVRRFAVRGEPGAMSDEEIARTIDGADLIYISGGDPVLGSALLENGGAGNLIRGAHARGASCMGGSAGSIVLASWWAEWPGEKDPKSKGPFDGGSLVPCLGVARDLVVDCHNEDSDWDELKLVGGMLAARDKRVRLIGLPAKGAIVVAGSGAISSLGEPCVEVSS